METENKAEVIQAVASPSFWNDSLAFSLTLSLILLSLVLIYVASLYHRILKSKYPSAYKAKVKMVKVKEESELMKALTDKIPLELEHTILMDHEYDGIRELDNNLPPWWKYGFYITIVWAVIYLFHYHVMGLGSSSGEEYLEELIAAEQAKKEFLAKAGEMVTADNVSYKKDPVSIAKGEAIFIGNCKTCHGANAQGDAGPNLTDAYWLNGGDIKSLFNIVTNGKKAMPSWASSLSPSDIQNVLSYIHTLQGSNPAGAKAAEGELYVESGATPVVSDSASAITDTTAVK